MTDTSIDELYENLRAADLSDEGMGEVRRLVALDKAIEVFKHANHPGFDVAMSASSMLVLASDIEAFLAGDDSGDPDYGFDP